MLFDIIAYLHMYDSIKEVIFENAYTSINFTEDGVSNETFFNDHS